VYASLLVSPSCAFSSLAYSVNCLNMYAAAMSILELRKILYVSIVRWLFVALSCLYVTLVVLANFSVWYFVHSESLLGLRLVVNGIIFIIAIYTVINIYEALRLSFKYCISSWRQLGVFYAFGRSRTSKHVVLAN